MKNAFLKISSKKPVEKELSRKFLTSGYPEQPITGSGILMDHV